MAWQFEDRQSEWTFEKTGEPVPMQPTPSGGFGGLVRSVVDYFTSDKPKPLIPEGVMHEMDPWATRRAIQRRFSDPEEMQDLEMGFFEGSGGRLAALGRVAQFAVLPQVPKVVRRTAKLTPTAEAVARADLPPAQGALDITPHIDAVLETAPPPRVEGAAMTAERIEEMSRPMMTAERAAEIETTITRALPEELKGVNLSLEQTGKVIDAFEEFYSTTGIKRDHNLPITMQIVRDMAEAPLLYASKLRPLLERAGISLEQVGEVFAATKSTAGRQLGELGRLAQKIEAVEELSELSQALARARDPVTGWDMASHFWGRMINLWRGSLVGAWVTAARNFASQSAQLGINAIETILDVAVRNVTRTGTAHDRKLTPALREIFEQFHTLVNRGKLKQVDDILSAFPDEQTRLFNRFSSDINVSSALEGGQLGVVGKGAEAAFNKAEKALNIVNFANRGQEFLIRRAAFRAKLSSVLERAGIDVHTVSPGQIDPTIISGAVDHALRMTMASSPKGGVWKSIMDLYANPVGKNLSFIAPFPRYAYNYWKYLFEYSPAGLLKMLSRAERTKIAEGDVRLLSRALVGTAMVGAAWQIRRDPDVAGEKWYETKGPGGTRIDWRPFGHFAAYLWLGELLKRMEKGEGMPPLEDMVQGVSISMFRAGAGLYLLDTVNEAIGSVLTPREGEADLTKLEKTSRGVRKTAGEIVGGFAQPITTYRELFAEYGKFLGERAGQLAEEEAKLREVREHPFTGPILRRIPLLSQTLPEKELPLEGDVPRQTPLGVGGAKFSRQLTGISVQTRNRIEAEANRLGLTYAELNPRTGEPKADRLIAKQMGPIADQFLGRLVSSGAYQRLDDAARRAVFTRMLSRVKEEARRRAIPQDPKLFAKIKFKQSVPLRTRELLEERGAIPPHLR